MGIRKARAIFKNLDDKEIPIEIKGLALRTVIDMETHNSVTKDQMLKAMDWMWSQIFEIAEDE